MRGEMSRTKWNCDRTETNRHSVSFGFLIPKGEHTMTKFTKITAIAAPAIMALAVASPSEAKILLMGDGGWEVSFDGLVNSFYSFQTTEQLSANDTATNATHTGVDADGQDTSRVLVGLLPSVWGMNIKAPTTNGLDMSARLGLYPSNQNARRKNTGGLGFGGGQGGAQMDVREIFMAVESEFGKILVGRTLSLYQGKNILSDMTLFGVGWNAGDGAGGGTTLGRIGAGYVYPNFNNAIRYTTPSLNGFTGEVGIFDPSTIGGNAAVTKTPTPRLEAEIAYAGNLGGLSVSAWVNGMWQEAQRTAAELNTACLLAVNGAMPAAGTTCTVNTTIDVGGGAFGMTLGYGGLTLHGSGYVGKGLGMAVMLDNDATDAKGQTRPHHGYYVQGTYAFGQGTSIGASYGESGADETSTDLLQRATTTVGQESVSLLDFMIWHDINKNLRVVAEYGIQEVEWHDGVEQDSDIVSVGGFFFW